MGAETTGNDRDERGYGRLDGMFLVAREGVTPLRRDRTSPRRGHAARTRDELYEAAKALNIEGRSKMDKRQLEAAVDRKRGRR